MASAGFRRALRAPPRATRAKPAFNYAESSSDNDTGEEVEDIESFIDTSPRPRSSRRGTKSRSTPKKRQRPPSSPSHDTDDSGNQQTPKKRKRSKPSTPKSIQAVDQGVASGVIPPWQNLPYHILVQVFRYATYPLYDEHTFQPLPSGRWLLSMARLCRNFAEPAFTVLYTTPPLVPMVQAHRLVDLLKADPKQMAFKYRQKVESLCIDVGQVAAYSLPGSGHLDLHGLIKDLPRLADLEFYHQKDMSPYRNLDDTIKWTYPEALFDALEYIDPAADPGRGDKTGICRLRSWRWSSRLAGKRWPIEKIPQIHLKQSFSSLRKIAFVNYQVPYVKKDEEDPKHENILAAALNNLRNLEHLIFESSTLVNHKLLPMLPTNLRNLELINCWEVVADDFAAFLLTHGTQLRCLTLNHNQSLSLSFLPVLGEACPKLQVLRMNLTYFNLHATYRDSEPQYEQLLLPTEVPVWPSTLQTIELIQMRKWETQAAEMFFQSLLDSTDRLPHLRKLSIQAILNIGWRDRASFRDKWVGSLSRVFKRVSDPPQTLVSVKRLSNVQKPKFQVQIWEGKDSTERAHPAAIPTQKSLRSSSVSNTASLSSLSTMSPQVYHSREMTRESLPTRQPTHSIGSDASSSSSLSSISSRVVKDRFVINIDQREQEKPSAPPAARRSTRTTTRQLRKGKYAESADNSGADTDASAREMARRNRVSKELRLLKATAGIDCPSNLSSPPRTPSDAGDSDSDSDAPLVGILHRNKGKGKRKAELIQGMCEIVEVRIDNLRPTETQVTEADFLDDEIPGDSDWDGDEDGDDGYAW